jgi:hypothetical protein
MFLNSYITYANISCDDNIFPEQVYNMVTESNNQYFRYDVSEIFFEDKIVDYVQNDWLQDKTCRLTFILQLDDNVDLTVYACNVPIRKESGLIVVFPSVFYYYVKGKVVQGKAIGKYNFC